MRLLTLVTGCLLLKATESKYERERHAGSYPATRVIIMAIFDSEFGLSGI